MRKLLVLATAGAALVALISWTTPHAHAAIAPVAPHIESSGYNPDGTCPQPPVAGDLSQLSDADLAKYGLPHRADPLFGSINKLRHRVCSGTVAPDAASGTTTIAPNVTSSSTTTLSGFHITNYGSSYGYSVKMALTMTTPSVNNSSTPLGSGVWFYAAVGGSEFVDGSPSCHDFGGTYELRAGVSSRRNSTSSFAYALDIQDYQDDTNPVDAIYISAGDAVSTYARYNPFAPDYDSYGYMYVADTTTGSYSTYHNTNVPSDCNSSVVASKWYNDPLADFGTVNQSFNGPFLADSSHSAHTDSPTSELNHIRWYMHNGNTGHDLAYPDADWSDDIGGAKFNNYWNAAS